MGAVQISIKNQGFFPAHSAGRIVIEQYGSAVRTYTAASFQSGDTVRYDAQYASNYTVRVFDGSAELDRTLINTITSDRSLTVYPNGHFFPDLGSPLHPPTVMTMVMEERSHHAAGGQMPLRWPPVRSAPSSGRQPMTARNQT